MYKLYNLILIIVQTNLITGTFDYAQMYFIQYYTPL